VGTKLSAATARWGGRYTDRRRVIQLAFLATFVLLPLFDLFRFDFGTGRLHLFRHEIWLDEWMLLWLALMFAMWLIGAVSLLFGRVFCAYACPQMVFSEIAHDIESLARRLTRRLDRKQQPQAQRAVSWTLILALSVAASVLFMGYFSPLPDVVQRLLRLDFGLWVGAVGATTTLIGFLNLVFVRERFCRSVCPYGLLQGVLEDGRSLHVAFDETTGDCIDCGACVRVCPMEIDIRDGAFQIECTRCGSCIDSCEQVLARLDRPTLLAFNLAGFSLKGWDAKRVLVAVATVGFAVALVFAVATRETFAVWIAPMHEAATRGEGDLAEEQFLLRAANRGTEPVHFDVRTEGLPEATVLEGLEDPEVPPGEERRIVVTVRVPRDEVSGTVTPFQWVVATEGREERFDAAFFVPGGSRS
jgi:cytochrome c oxidase accessory protein FixG